MKFSPHKYKLIIFDWDGTLVNSTQAYSAWDKLYAEKFYGVNLPVVYFEKLAAKMKAATPPGGESSYFRYLDEQYGSGVTPMETIWKNLYSLAPKIQKNILYREGAVEVLTWLRDKTNAHLALATNAEMRDIRYFSSKESKTAQHLSPLDFFDTIITSDDVNRPKPHPETFQKVIAQYEVKPSEIVIFEDSVEGVTAARATGSDVIAVFAGSDVGARVHLLVENWGEVLHMLQEGVS
ncbi:HAD family phosphatase [Candidatus Saccharibacteria bacterium]|nr:HAD family phosphatase [Candidatus Saccharibacteria bacterium]